MKRIIGYTTLMVIFMALGIIGLLNRTTDSFSKDLLNTNLYRFDGANGNYDELKLTSTEIYYKGTELGIETCKSYKYNKDTNNVTLDCNKNFRVILETEDTFGIEINNTKYLFFKDKQRSYEYAFENTFETTLEDYKIEGEESLETLQINYDTLVEKFNDTNLSYIYLTSNNCGNTCLLFNKEFLNISSNPNKYVLNIDNITDEQYNNLLTSFEGLKEKKEEYKIPSVLTISNEKLDNILEIELKGFDTKKYNNYFDNLNENMVNNEENN